MARAGLSGQVTGSYFLGGQATASCPLPGSAGERVGNEISSMDPLTSLENYGCKSAHLSSSKPLFICQKYSVQLEIEFLLYVKYR